MKRFINNHENGYTLIHNILMGRLCVMSQEEFSKLEELIENCEYKYATTHIFSGDIYLGIYYLNYPDNSKTYEISYKEHCPNICSFIHYFLSKKNPNETFIVKKGKIFSYSSLKNSIEITHWAELENTK